MSYINGYFTKEIASVSLCPVEVDKWLFHKEIASVSLCPVEVETVNLSYRDACDEWNGTHRGRLRKPHPSTAQERH